MLEFSVASKDGYGEKQTTTWVKCALWGKRADSLAPYLNSGTKVLIDGTFKLTKREYNGQVYTDLVCNVDQVELIGSKENHHTASTTQSNDAPDFDSLDDLPF